MLAVRHSVSTCFQAHRPKALWLAPQKLVQGVLGRACSTYIFHRVFRWLQDQRGQRAQLELRSCRRGEKHPSSLGWEQKQPRPRAISPTWSLTDLPKPPHLPEAPPRLWTGPRPGHPPPAPRHPLPRLLFSSEARNPRRSYATRPRRETRRAPPRHDLGERGGTLTPPKPLKLLPTQRAAATQAVSPTPACLRQKIKSG